MISTSDIKIRNTLFVAIALLAASMANERTAIAQEKQSKVAACYASADTVIVDGKISKSIELTVNRGSSAVIHVPGGIKNSVRRRDPRFVVALSPDDTRVYIVPTARARVTHTKSGRIEAKEGFDVGFRVTVVGKNVKARDSVKLIHRNEQERIEALVTARSVKLFGAQMAACAKQTRQARESTVDREIRRMALEALGQQPIYPVLDEDQQSAGPLHIELTQAQQGKGVLLAFFNLENRGEQPVKASLLGLYNRANTLMPTRHVYLIDAIRQSDKAVQQLLTGEMPTAEKSLVKGKYSLDRTLMPAEKVAGVIAIPVTDEYDISPYAIRLYSGADKPLAQSGVEGWTTMRPIYRKEMEENRRRLERQRERERRARQVAVSVRALYGGFWADDAVDLTEAIDGTAMGGLSIRVSKGLFHNLAFEGEFVGGRSGTAQFRDVSWQTMQGDVTRRASFGRLHAAGVVRFGTKHVVSTRLGVGVQGTNYNSSFITSNSTMSGPGDSFEFDGVWAVGASFDTHLSKDWTLGTGATFTKFVSSAARTLEAGIHLGYRWDP